MEPTKETQISPDRSELSKLYPQVLERGGVRQDVPGYQNSALNVRDEEEKIPYVPLRLVGLGALYSFPFVFFVFLVGKGETAATIVLGVILAAIMSLAFLKLLHGVVATELEKLQYNLRGFLLCYWLSFWPMTAVMYKALQPTYVGNFGIAFSPIPATVTLFLLIGYIMARTSTRRYSLLWGVVVGSWLMSGINFIA